MSSGLWAVSMTVRAGRISVFVTPFELLESFKMPFGLKNALQIHHRLLDNGLNDFLVIRRSLGLKSRRLYSRRSVARRRQKSVLDVGPISMMSS